MAYLIAKDLAKQIQSENLAQITGGDSSILDASILTAIAEMQSYLTQKYDVTQEFKDLIQWDKALPYNPTDRVYLNATAYSVSATYAVGALVLQAGSVYKCTTAVTVAEAFNPAKWTVLGAQYTFFFAKYPKPLFNYNQQYAVGDQVYWKGKTYTCAIQTRPLSQQTALQYRQYQNLPFLNVVPDDVNEGVQYWGAGVAYTVPADTDILNTAYWTAGDNRNQQIVTYLVDITLYHVHSRIAPRNIPELRVIRYDHAIQWLKMAARGEITAALPIIQPTQGGRIRYGGNIKQINSY